MLTIMIGIHILSFPSLHLSALIFISSNRTGANNLCIACKNETDGTADYFEQVLSSHTNTPFTHAVSLSLSLSLFLHLATRLGYDQDL